MEIIQKILTSGYFKDMPPVLVDVGASGEINAKWKAVAPFSVCICFDADDRDFKIDTVENSGYKSLIKINRVIVENEDPIAHFYLTRSPHCSSTLAPLSDELKPWIFSSYFDVVNNVEMLATTIEKALSAAGVAYIDWLKLDTQGTDLRLYKSLPAKIKELIIAAELEPGIIDAYSGEDKLHDVLQLLHADGFWLCDMKVKGTQRIDEKYLQVYGAGNLGRAVPESPGWAELTYLKKANLTNIRSLWLLYIFALMQQQYGFALEVCTALKNNSNDPLVEEAQAYVLDFIKSSNLIKYPFKKRVKNYLIRLLKN